MVTPNEPITVEGHVRHAEKHLAAHVVSDLISRLDKTGSDQASRFDPQALVADEMPLNLGLEVDETGRAIGPAIFPLSQFIHGIITGASGSGKSFCARVLVEEACQQSGLSILVLDPGNQFAGLLLPEDRPRILQQYDQFNMKAGDPRGFPFDYFAPGMPYAPTLPTPLSNLAGGRSIVSLKGLDDEHRCRLAGRILQEVFDACSADESDRPRLLILIDEFHLLTRRRVSASAKEAAAKAERAIDRIARLGRKHGVVMVAVSQSMRDFSHDLASVRQMAAVKIFLRNGDRDIEAAAEAIGDGRPLAQLSTGTALLHHADWGLHRFRIRPPYSLVRELNESQIRQLLEPSVCTLQALSLGARNLLAVIAEHSSPPHPPLILSDLVQLSGITSKRRLHNLIDQLEQTGAIRTHRLAERGQPRVVTLTMATDQAVEQSADPKST